MAENTSNARPLTKNLMFEVMAFAADVTAKFAYECVSSEDDMRAGGALLLTSQDFQLGKVLGDVSEHDGLRFSHNALNKNTAMAEHGVILSEAVADPEGVPAIYGGGIQLSDGSYMAFSGFPPEWDQAYCLMLAERFSLITAPRVQSIIHASSNPLEARVLYQDAQMFLIGEMMHQAFEAAS